MNAFDASKIPCFGELCFIYHQRNLINKARVSAYHKLHYFNKIYKKYTRPNLSNLENEIATNPLSKVKMYKNFSQKELNDKLIELRSNFKIAMANRKKHTKRYHKKALKLLKKSNFRTAYAVDGYVELIQKDDTHDYSRGITNYNDLFQVFRISKTRIEKYSVQYQLDVAIEKMLKSNK